MSTADMTAVTAFAVAVPFAGGLLLAAAGGARRMRRALGVLYAVVAVVFDLALLNGYLRHPARACWGSLRFTSLTFPAFFMLGMLTAGGVLFASFRRTEAARPAVVAASIAAAGGFGGLALAVSTTVPQMFLWLGATAAAAAGLLAHGGPGSGMRLRAFIPWLAADAMFVAGVVLSSLLLEDTSVLVKPPLTSGGEAEVVVILSLFLASALLRLGVFPAQGWMAGLVGRTDVSWSGYHLGCLNFLMAGMRLVVTVTLLARLAASDWGPALAVASVFSIAAGPVLAARSRNVQGVVSGFYCMISGVLLFSLATYSRAGSEAALFVLLTAPLSITALVMASGTAVCLKGSRAVGIDRADARAAPGAFVAMVVSGLAVAGLPITDGFVGRSHVVLAGFDKAQVTRFYALGSVIAIAAAAVALVAACRLVGGVFGGREGRPAAERTGPVEGLVPPVICAFSVLLGLFPALLLRNFISGASRLLYSPGFQGPSVVFRGTGGATASALRSYGAWGQDAAAFLLLSAVIVLASYFASRAANPSEGGPERRAPWLDGAAGRYAVSPGGTSARPREAYSLPRWLRAGPGGRRR